MLQLSGILVRVEEEAAQDSFSSEQVVREPGKFEMALSGRRCKLSSSFAVC